MSILSRTCLTRIEARKLEDMVEQHRKEFEEGKWTYRSFADHATQQMKRPVTESNVKTACHVMEINLRSKRKTECNWEQMKMYRDLGGVMRDVAKQLEATLKAIDLLSTDEFDNALEWLEEFEEEDDHDT